MSITIENGSLNDAALENVNGGGRYGFSPAGLQALLYMPAHTTAVPGGSVTQSLNGGYTNINISMTSGSPIRGK